MKRTTLWALCATALCITINRAKAQTTYAQFSATPASQISNDGTGQIGIGTTPSGTLHIKSLIGSSNPIIRATYQSAATNPDYYFMGERYTLGAPGNPPTYKTHIVIDNQGYIGIGTLSPESPINITHKFHSGTNPFADNPVIAINDPDFQVFNLAMSGDGTSHGVSMVMQSNGSPTWPAFVIHDGIGQGRLSVMGNGVVGFGLNNTDVAEAHINIFSRNIASFILDVRNNSGIRAFNIHESGNIGIGVVAGSSTAKLAVRGNIDLYYNSTTPPALRITNSGGAARHIITDTDGDLVIDPGVGGGANDKVEVKGNLDLSGSFTVKNGSSNEFKIGIDGKVRAREVQVDLATIPDYVFDKNYKLPTIEELEAFVNTNKHLPNVPSECEFEKQGYISLTEMNLVLLEKIEELSLYVILLNEKIKSLEK